MEKKAMKGNLRTVRGAMAIFLILMMITGNLALPPKTFAHARTVQSAAVSVYEAGQKAIIASDRQDKLQASGTNGGSGGLSIEGATVEPSEPRVGEPFNITLVISNSGQETIYYLVRPSFEFVPTSSVEVVPIIGLPAPQPLAVGETVSIGSLPSELIARNAGEVTCTAGVGWSYDFADAPGASTEYTFAFSIAGTDEGPLSVDVWTDKGGQGHQVADGTYKIGDPITIYKSVNKDCTGEIYLYPPSGSPIYLGPWKLSSGVHPLTGLTAEEPIGQWSIEFNAWTNGESFGDRCDFEVIREEELEKTGIARVEGLVKNREVYEPDHIYTIRITKVLSDSSGMLDPSLTDMAQVAIETKLFKGYYESANVGDKVEVYGPYRFVERNRLWFFPMWDGSKDYYFKPGKEIEPLSVDVWTDKGGRGHEVPDGKYTIDEDIIIRKSVNKVCYAEIYLYPPSGSRIHLGPWWLEKIGEQHRIKALIAEDPIGKWKIEIKYWTGETEEFKIEFPIGRWSIEFNAWTDDGGEAVDTCVFEVIREDLDISEVELNRSSPIISEYAINVRQQSLSEIIGCWGLAEGLHAYIQVTNPSSQEANVRIKWQIIDESGDVLLEDEIPSDLLKRYSIPPGESLTADAKLQFKGAFGPRKISPGKYKVRFELKQKSGIFDYKVIGEKDMPFTVKPKDEPTVGYPRGDYDKDGKDEPPQGQEYSLFKEGEVEVADALEYGANLIWLLIQAMAGIPDPSDLPWHGYFELKGELERGATETGEIYLKQEWGEQKGYKILNILWGNAWYQEPDWQNPVAIDYDRAVVSLVLPRSVDIIDDGGADYCVPDEDKDTIQLTWIYDAPDKLLRSTPRFFALDKPICPYQVKIKPKPDNSQDKIEVEAFLRLEVGPLRGRVTEFVYYPTKVSPQDIASIYDYNKWQQSPNDVYWAIIGTVRTETVVEFLPIEAEEVVIALRAAYGTSKTDPNYNPAADLNSDGIVDYKDLAILGSKYGKAK